MKIKKEIIDKVLDNAASIDEVKEVNNWFATNEGQEYLSEQLTAESMLMSEEEIKKWGTEDIPTNRMKERFLKQIGHHHRTLKWWRIAAVIFPFLVLSSTVAFLLNKTGILHSTQYAEIVVPCGEQITVILQDGTVVNLNSATTLKYPKRFGLFSRNVKLEGEAYFEVAKDQGRPFTVQTTELDVRVVGTQFNVKAYPSDNHIYVTLDEGGVLLKTINDSELPLFPGESAIYNCQSNECEITHIDADEVKAWRTNSLICNMMPLRDIIKIIERQYDITFIVNDSTILNSKFTISANKVNVRDVLHDLERVSHIEFLDKGNNEFVVNRKD